MKAFRRAAPQYERQSMPPRIRSFLSRPPYKREASAPAHSNAKTRVNALTAPTVFREFVETLQRLDQPSSHTVERRRYGVRRPRKQLGNGHARPRRSRRGSI
jgi:hypothetical protein